MNTCFCVCVSVLCWEAGCRRGWGVLSTCPSFHKVVNFQPFPAFFSLWAVKMGEVCVCTCVCVRDTDTHTKTWADVAQMYRLCGVYVDSMEPSPSCVPLSFGKRGPSVCLHPPFCKSNLYTVWSEFVVGWISGSKQLLHIQDIWSWSPHDLL